MRGVGLCGIFLLLVVCLGGTVAHADELPRHFDIPASKASEGLALFAEQSGIPLIYLNENVRNKRTNRVAGSYTTTKALEILLSGTGIDGSFNERRVLTVTVEKSGDDAENEFVAANEKSPEGKGGSVKKRGLLAAIAATLGAGASNGVGADQASETVSTQTKLSEIVVTATKRSLNIQDVPQSISVISNEEIDRKGVVGQADLLRTLPGVTQIDLGAARNSIIMRGVSADPQNDPAGQTVGYYLNDVPLTGYTFRGGADVKLIDLEQVEVIRGPQGTLYGSASLGGAVRNAPNPPNLSEFQGYVKAGYSETDKAGSDNSAIEGVLNVPVVKGKFAVRAVAYQIDNSGYVENIAGSDPATIAAATAFGVPELAVDETDVGNDEYSGGRVSILFEPSDRLAIDLLYLTQDITQEGLPEVELIRAGKFQQARLQMGDLVGGGGEELRDDIDIVNATFEYAFDRGTLLSSSSWIDEDYLEKRGIGAFFGGIPVPQRNPGGAEVFAQELRFASDFAGPVQLLVGLYYEDVSKFFTALNYYGGDPALNPFSDVLLTDNLIESDYEQEAAFGELAYSVTDKLTLTLGARWFSYDRVDTTTTVDAAFTVAGVQAIEANDDGSTFKANLSYEPTENSVLYAQWSEGFRIGIPVAPAPSVCDVDGDGIIDGTNLSAGARQLDPDTIESYEIGSKLTFLEGNVVVNVAAYHNEWQGVPVTIIIPCGFGTADNAGEARTQGIEFESQYYLTPSLLFTLGAAYTDAELTEDAPGVGEKGDRLAGTPEYTVSLGAQYEFSVLNHPSFVRADYLHVDGFFNNLQETGTQAGDYGLLNVRGGIDFEHFGIELFVNNVTNSDELTWVDNVFDGVDDRAYRLRPRTIGVNLQFRF